MAYTATTATKRTDSNMTTTRNIINGNLYLTATSRGTEYTLQRLCGAWFVGTRRLGLGRFNAGGGKHYATLADVAAGCKAFGTEQQLTVAWYGFTEEQAA